MRRVTMIAIAALVGAAGCHWAAGGFGASSGTGGGGAFAECREKRAPVAARPAPPPADPAFARLGAFRSTVTLDGVTPFEAHFAVTFTCVEESVDYYAVAADGTVRREGGAWGGLVPDAARLPQVPAERRADADRVRAAHDAAYEHAGAPTISYLGSYREVTVAERLPVSPPGDPYQRMMWYARVTLRAGADLASFDGLARLDGGETRLCWRDLDVVACDAPRWIDVAIAPATTPQLVALVRDGSPAPVAARAAFRDAVLAAARDLDAGRPGAALDAVLARQGDALVPPELGGALGIAFTVRAGGRAPARLAAPVPLIDALRGTATARAHLDAGGEAGAGAAAAGPVSVEVTAAAVTPLAADARGELAVPVRLAYRVRAGADERTAAAVITVHAVVDGATALATSVDWPAEATSHPDAAPLHQRLGAGAAAVDVRVGVDAGAEPWWGP